MYDPVNDEYFNGKCFKRDGSDYDPSYPSIDLFQVYNEISGLGANMFQVTVCGKLYKGGTPISGDSRKLALDDIEIAALSHFTGVPEYATPELAIYKLFDMNEVPEHITGIFFHPLD